MLKRIAIGLAFAAVLAVGIGVYAQNKTRHYPLGTLLNNVALNAGAPALTFTVGPDLGNDELLDYEKLALTYTYTHNNNGTMTTTCTTGATGATATATMTTCDTTTTPGTCIIKWAGIGVTPSLTTDKEWFWRLGMGGARALSCVVAHGGSPDSNDRISVTGEVRN